MTHDKIFEKCKEICVLQDSEVTCWYPNGKGSVRVKTDIMGEFIFTYKSKKVWKFESVDSYLESIKVEVK